MDPDPSSTAGRRVYGSDHDDPDPGPVPGRRYAELVGGPLDGQLDGSPGAGARLPSLTSARCSRRVSRLGFGVEDGLPSFELRERAEDPGMIPAAVDAHLIFDELLQRAHCTSRIAVLSDDD